MGAPSPALGTVQNIFSDSGFKLQTKEDVKQILNWTPPKNYDKLFPYEISGTSKDGCPIMIMAIGKWQILSVLEKGEKEQLILYWHQAWTRLAEKMNETGKSQSVCIVDMNGFSVNYVTSFAYCQFCIEAAKIFTRHYSDMIGTVNFINAPRVFGILFSIVKPFLSAKFLSTITIYSTSNRDDFKKSILANISPDQLPVAFGGTQTQNNICEYLEGDCANATDKTLQRHVTEDGIEMVTVEIDPGQEYKLDLEITKPNTTIEWNFKSEKEAIRFFILYNSCDEIFPRIVCESQVGSINCEKKGTYSLVFENKNNQMQMETLHFIVGVFE